MRLLLLLTLIDCAKKTCTTSSQCDRGQVCRARACVAAIAGQPADVCGNGVVEEGEACDDGNTNDNDYCTPDCATISGSWDDGVVQSNELCDDGNSVDGDYCSNDRQVIRLCGDTHKDSNEACDDGNAIDGDHCSNDCLTARACGDGHADTGEVCDDGNTADGDYCNADCSMVTGACGDAIAQGNEACDDGNTAADDYCSSDCGTITGACGDGTLQGNETCDTRIASTYCHACDNATITCLGNNACNHTDQSIGSGNAWYSSSDCTTLGANFFVGELQFTTATDSTGDLFLTGGSRAGCRLVDTTHVVPGQSYTPRSFRGGPAGGCGSGPYTRHTLSCPVGEVAIGMRGYEAAPDDGWTCGAFLIPICATYNNAKAGARSNTLAMTTELFGPTGLGVEGASNIGEGVGFTRPIAESVAVMDTHLSNPPPVDAVRTVDYVCPIGQAIFRVNYTGGCFYDGIGVDCATLP